MERSVRNKASHWLATFEYGWGFTPTTFLPRRGYIKRVQHKKFILCDLPEQL